MSETNIRPDASRLHLIRRSRHRAVAEIIQHEKPDCGGQVALLAVAVDLADQFGQRHIAQIAAKCENLSGHLGYCQY
jgi:hypothetical protein